MTIMEGIIVAAAFEQHHRSTFCGRHIDGFIVRNVRREPSVDGENVTAIDL